MSIITSGKPNAVDGKPTTVNQVYLGTADKVETLLGRGGFSPKEFGSVFILNELDKDLDLAGIINEILPPRSAPRDHPWANWCFMPP